MSDGSFVHESAYVDDGATIGAGTKVWHFCHVMPGAVIGAVFLTLLSDALRDTQQLQNVLYGAAILVMLRFAPDGVISLPARLASWLRPALRQA